MSAMQQRGGGERRQHDGRETERRVGERRLVCDIGPEPEFRSGVERREAGRRGDDRRQSERRALSSGLPR